jgi:lipopolysaccharide/colanic/teichoic acid biosynthesis glycosyltransferase
MGRDAAGPELTSSPKSEVPVTIPLRNSSFLHPHNGNSHDGPASLPVASIRILSQEDFAHTLYLERKRTERSGRPFVLMLLESTRLLKTADDGRALQQVLLALSRSSRDTDTKGWHKQGYTIGVIYTELGPDADGRAVAGALLTKVTTALAGTLTISQLNEIRLTFHVFPEDLAQSRPVDQAESNLYDELLHETAPKRLPRLTKRMMDIAGSLLALLLFLPVFLAIAIAIKLTSKGPVFYCQQRLGQYGRKFRFLKFRSMYVNNDETIHRDFVRSFIAVNASSRSPQGQTVYKLMGDPRITPIGHFLRKTSLDEVPQFLNVLLGDMSLVGPRPAVTYEAECYHMWHRTRLLAAKPGLTGLWQVAGRSRVKFDDMVRMDLQYATSWSLWLDIKILLQTPHAVLTAYGAH